MVTMHNIWTTANSPPPQARPESSPKDLNLLVAKASLGINSENMSMSVRLLESLSRVHGR